MQEDTSSEVYARHSRNSGGGLCEDAHFSTVASGRSEWRRDEHGRFMQALELYGSRKTGDEWRHITAFVGSRTIEEVHLHGRQYLKRLVQQLPASAEASRNLVSAGSQNDESRQNYQIPKSFDPRGKRPVPVSTRGNRALNTAAFECAQSMRNPFSPQFRNQSLQYPQHQMGNTSSRWQSKPWTFHEDKVFETALARWAGGKSYPWARIAASIPGKTAKDVCSRYEDMIGEIASIESETLPVSTAIGSMSTLSQRTVPPPPIEVPSRIGSKDGAMSIFPPSRRSRSRRGSASGFTMLSPTFLDYLAKEAESEEKPSLPTLPLPFPGQLGLPSPLFSPTLLPSGSPGFLSTGDKNLVACGQQGARSIIIDSKMKVIDDTNSTSIAVKTEEPQNSRVLNEFLADDFRFDDPIGIINHSSRKSLPGSFTEGSKLFRSNAGRQDVEMADASAA